MSPRVHRSLLPSLLLLSPAAVSAAPGVELPFPLVATGEVGPLGAVELQPLPSEILALRDEEAVTLIAAPLPDGPVDLRLVRVPIDPRANVYVDGELREGGLDSGDLSLWKGRIAGDDDSDVLLGFSLHGCYGWLDDGNQRIELLAVAGPERDWSRATARFVPAELILAIGPESGPSCAADTTRVLPIDPASIASSSGSRFDADTLVCPIAIETDYQLFQVWGNLTAMQNYVAILLGAVSDRYLEQIDVTFTFPYVGFYTDPNDPWTTQDSGTAGCGDVLNEFRNAWAYDIPNDAALGHFISGAWLGCGVAWVDVLCNGGWGFSLSCCINGGVSFPVHQGSNTWDFYVMAHELGHNFGSPHTHDFCPPLDQCAGNCTGTTQCTSQGTNMSYCHGCPGGMTNITTYFHQTVADLMRDRAESASCLEPWCVSTITRYCTASPNSVGTGALIDHTGSASLAAADLVLVATELPPGQFLMFYYGGAPASAPFGNGIRCVGWGGVGLFRLKPGASDDLGLVFKPFDYDAPPANGGLGEVLPGDACDFQGWYRDPAGGGAQYNLTDALEIHFCF